MGYSNAAILENAKKLKGKYVLGGNGPSQWDCSSFVSCAISGASSGRLFGTATQVGWLLNNGFTEVTDSVNLSTGAGMIPGDILWLQHSDKTNANGHTGIYYGNGKTIEATGSAYSVPNFPSVSRSSSTDKWQKCFRAGAISLEYWPIHGEKQKV